LENSTVENLDISIAKSTQENKPSDVSVVFKAVSLTTDGDTSTFSLEIHPVDSSKPDEILPNTYIAAPVTIHVKLPVGFPIGGLYAKHHLDDGKFEELEVIVSDDGYASWQQTSFSQVDLISDSTHTVTDNTTTDTDKTTTDTNNTDVKTDDSDSKTTGSKTSGSSSRSSSSSSNVVTTTTTPTTETNPAAAATTPETVLKPLPFSDVSDTAYYRYAVQWATENGITSGTSDTAFSPNSTCTRAQVITFLWRAAGSPAPTSTDNPFTDLPLDSYYHNAILWAVEQGITSGTGDGTFGPNSIVTRSQVVTFLYRAAGSPTTDGTSFQDVASGSYYENAVRWAVEQGITSGTSDNTFGPADFCTRAQVVTFLYQNAIK
jgi:hypothetical protein